MLPLFAVAVAGVPAEHFSTGAWADAAHTLGGIRMWPGVVLALMVVLGGTINGVGMFNALMMSYTRVPYAMAEERLLPAALKRRLPNGVPWVSVLVCGLAWAFALGMTLRAADLH